MKVGYGVTAFTKWWTNMFKLILHCHKVLLVNKILSKQTRFKKNAI